MSETHEVLVAQVKQILNTWTIIPASIASNDAEAEESRDALARDLIQWIGDSLKRVIPDEEKPDKMRIYLNTNIKMSRGKAAAHAVHAALSSLGVHPGVPVVVLGMKPRAIERMRTVIRDAGTTELEAGTMTAGTNWPLHDVPGQFVEVEPS